MLDTPVDPAAGPDHRPDPARSSRWRGLPDARTWTAGLRSWPPDPYSLAVVLGAAWAAVANLARLATAPVTIDERLYAIAGWRYLHGEAGPVPSGDSSNFDNYEHPPLAKYLFGVAQLLAGHRSVVADRVVAAVCTLATCVVLGVWVGRVAGRWTGLGAGVLLAVIPTSVPGFAGRFGRFGVLDPVAEVFAVGAVVLAWTWFHRAGADAWRFAAAAGACAGLATAAKENGFLGIVGPVVVGLAVSAVRAGMAAVGRRAAQAALAAVTASVVFAAAYLPLVSPTRAIAFLLRFQDRHADLGHLVTFDGRTTTHPPGWAFLWFAAHGLGAAVTVAALVCAVAAIGLRRDAVVLWCLGGLAGPLVFHLAAARVILGFYWVMWLPLFVALIALGLTELVGLARTASSRMRTVAALLAVATVVVLAGGAVHDTAGLASLNGRDVAPYPAAVAGYAPLVYLRLDDRTGSSAADNSGQRHPGVYRGGPHVGVAGLLTGDPDTAVAFHGSGQYALLQGSSWMDAADYSVAIWFRSTRGGYLVSRDNFRAGKVWNLQLTDSGEVRFVTYSAYGGHGQTISGSAGHADGRPHLAVGVRQGTTMRLYVDGSPAAVGSWPTYATSTSLGIDLAQRGNGANAFAGTLDDFAFFDVPLSAAQVRHLYSVGTGHA